MNENNNLYNNIVAKIITIATLLLPTIPIHAQITINTTHTTNNTLPSILQADIFNNTNTKVSGYLDFKIYKNNTLQTAGQSNTFELPAKSNFTINQLNNNQILLPLNLTFVENSISQTLRNGYVFPDGTYRVCIKFIAGSSIQSEENCTTRIIRNPNNTTTLQLFYPADNKTTTTLNPIFSWKSIGKNIFYTIKITEVLQSQLSTKGTAINNPVFYTVSEINTFNYFYPIHAPTLEPCKTYEWQVTAYQKKQIPQDAGSLQKRQVLARSKVFRFKTDCQQENRRPPARDNYFKLDKRNSPYVHPLETTKITFSYKEKYQTDKVKLEIKDRTGTALISLDDFPPNDTLISGTNYLFLGAENYPELSAYIENEEALFLELSNQKGEIWKAKFKFQL